MMSSSSRPQARERLADLPPQTGRTVVVTGATSGIGLETARELLRAGARVVLAVRDPDAGRHAVHTLLSADTAGAGTAEVRPLDLASLASVRRFARDWDGPLDVLVNNAGVANVPLRRTEDGFELHFGTNHLGHFALTRLLLPHVTDRVVTVASTAHRGARLDLADPNWHTRRHWPSEAYGQSKLANLLFTLELQRRLAEDGSPVRALAAHPGAAATGLNRHLGPVMRTVAAVAARTVLQSPQAGALPVLWAATGDWPGGTYLGPGGRGERRGSPAPAGRSATALDEELAARLWAVSEHLVGD